MATKNKYVTAKLDWAENQIEKWEKYLEENPYHLVVDRITLKEKKDGGVMPITSASIEAQQKNQRDTMKEYLELLAVVKRLREQEDAATETKEGYAGVGESIRMKLAQKEKDE
jgi:hypothetical protein